MWVTLLARPVEVQRERCQALKTKISGTVLIFSPACHRVSKVCVAWEASHLDIQTSMLEFFAFSRLL